MSRSITSILTIALGLALGLGSEVDRSYASGSDATSMTSAAARKPKPKPRKPRRPPPMSRAAKAKAAKAKEAADKAAAEQAAAEQAAKDAAVFDQEAVAQAAREQAARDQAAIDEAARKAAEEQAALDAPVGAPEMLSSGDWVTKEFIAFQKDQFKLFRRETRAARRPSGIKIDGILDDKAWDAVQGTRFSWQERPIEGGTATAPTEFKVLYDDKALYVGVHSYDPEPKKIAGNLHRPQGTTKVPQSDWVFIYIDPSLSRRMAYGFALNPAGVKMNLRQFPAGELDSTYTAVWEGRASRDKTGWYAEFKVPFSQMRVRDGYQDRWGFQIQRRIRRTQERNYWSPFTFRSGTDITGYGNLVIENDIHAGRPIEILPYLLGGTRLERKIPRADPFNSKLDPTYSMGADLKMQISRSLRLTASINPDFGQVEADPSEVNLTDNETFFSELRPLFVEDADLYQLKIGRGDENLFYSRRIGARPTFTQQDTAKYLDEPEGTTIYGAAKVSGEIGGGVNIGLLSALGAEETSRAQLADGMDTIKTQVIEPMTSYNVAQLSKTFRGGASDLRIAATGVNRFNDEAPVEALHDRAYAGAIQYLHQFDDNRWALFGMVGASRVHGDALSIVASQTASQRYYQRTDATHLELDPTLTSLKGYTVNAQLRKIAGAIHAELGVDARSPGFDVNDLGFLTSADLINPWLRVSRNDPAVGGQILKEAVVAATVETFSDFQPDLLRHRGTLQLDVGFANYWKASATAQYTKSVIDTRLLRGGPSVVGQDSFAGTALLGSDIRKSFQATLSTGVTTRPVSDSLRLNASLALVWNARPNIELSFTPSWTRNVDDSQFVGRAKDMNPMAAPHYVLGRLRQTTLAATTRVNYTITPQMSLQLYAQPFLSGGEYIDYKESAQMRASSYGAQFTQFNASQVTEDDTKLSIDADGNGTPDFSVKRPLFSTSAPSYFIGGATLARLISNVVFRWEYLPGSTFYVIWSQGRLGSTTDPIASGDVGDVFTNPGAHVFLVKLSYWWSL